MVSQRWKSLNKLLESVLERPEEKRDAYLEEACAGNLPLRKQIEELLRLEEPAGRLLESPPLVSMGGDPAGRRIGAYEIIRELGRGGMGAVYLARRADRSYEKTVALKLIREGLFSGSLARRFQRERQILANLDHPYIARLLDAGATDWGTPFLVMEYVEGEPIDRYCQGLTLRARLRLFVRVCEAVHFAHQNLVVHRDLKPGNILVTSSGTPKLLDFGIARLMDSNPGDAASTTTGIRAMSPRYASPEQFMGKTITTASDIYSLGVLLYETVTGTDPYQLKSTDIRSLERAICEKQPAKPSVVVNKEGCHSQKARRELRGDVDLILLKALQKEPADRYASIQQFSADMQAYLFGFPVAAAEPTRLYKILKFMRRHPKGLAVTGLVILLLIAFTTQLVVQRQRISMERDQVRLERDKFQRLTELMIDLFEVSDPSQNQSTDISAREILERGSRKVRDKLRDSPRVKTEMLGILGRVNTNLGQYDSAEALFREALSLNRELYPADHWMMAQSLTAIGEVLWEKGDFGAEAFYREALLAVDDLPADQALLPATIHNNLGMTLHDKGDYEQAIHHYDRALTISREHLGEEHLELTEMLNNKGMALREMGDYDGAESLFRADLAITRKNLGEDHIDVAIGLSNLGALMWKKEDYSSAESLMRQALAIQRKRLNEHPDLATSLNNLGILSTYLGRYYQAEKFLNESLAMRRKFYGEKHFLIAQSVQNLGFLMSKLERNTLAEEQLRGALAMHRELLGGGHPWVANNLKNLAHVLIARGAPEQAENLLRKALEINRESFGNQHASVAGVLLVQGIASLEQNRPHRAEQFFREAFTIYSELYGERHLGTAKAKYHLGLVALGVGDLAISHPLLQHAMNITENHLGSLHPSMAEVLVSLARVETRLGMLAEAGPKIKRAREVLAKSLPEEHWERARAECVWGEYLHASGDFDAGTRHLKSGYALLLKKRGERSFEVLQVKKLMATLGI